MKNFVAEQKQGVSLSPAGFTLVELMVALAVTSILTTILYLAFSTQLRSYSSQDQVAEMQQMLRAGLRFIGNDLVMTGYNPTGEASPGVVAATSTSVEISMDLDSDQKTITAGEDLIYRVEGNTLCRVDKNVDADTCVAVADNIQNIEFYYTFEDGTKAISPDPNELTSIRAVQVTLLTQSKQKITGYNVAETFKIPSGATWTGPADGRRRAMLSSTVQLRNMGL